MFHEVRVLYLLSNYHTTSAKNTGLAQQLREEKRKVEKQQVKVSRVHDRLTSSVRSLPAMSC